MSDDQPNQLPEHWPLRFDELRPYVVVSEQLRGLLRPAASEELVFDPFSDFGAEFCRAIITGNRIAFDGDASLGAQGALGMPGWVFLDCVVLTTAVFGYAAPAEQVPERWRSVLDPAARLQYIPVSEYIAVPTRTPDEFSGISMFSLCRGFGLGRKTKQMAFERLGVKSLVAVTQVENPSLATHLSFGPMEILQFPLPLHSRPDRSLFYRWSSTLRRGQVVDSLTIDPRSPDDRAALAAWMRRFARCFLVSCGSVVGHELQSVTFEAEAQ